MNNTAIKAILCGFLGAAFLGAYASNNPRTLAWRHVFNNGTADDLAAGIDTDAGGNAYLAYRQVGSTGSDTLHFVKIGPSNVLYFDTSIAFATTIQPFGTYVSP